MKSASPTQAKDACPRGADKLGEIEILQDESANSGVTANSEVGFFGDEERLAKEPRLRD
jgi:hypothetical protein